MERIGFVVSGSDEDMEDEMNVQYDDIKIDYVVEFFYDLIIVRVNGKIIFDESFGDFEVVCVFELQEEILVDEVFVKLIEEEIVMDLDGGVNNDKVINEDDVISYKSDMVFGVESC